MELTPQQLAKIERKIADMERQDVIHRYYEQLKQIDAACQRPTSKTYTPEQLHAINVRQDYSQMDLSEFDTILNSAPTPGGYL